MMTRVSSKLYFILSMLSSTKIVPSAFGELVRSGSLRAVVVQFKIGFSQTVEANLKYS